MTSTPSSICCETLSRTMPTPMPRPPNPCCSCSRRTTSTSGLSGWTGRPSPDASSQTPGSPLAATWPICCGTTWSPRRRWPTTTRSRWRVPRPPPPPLATAPCWRISGWPRRSCSTSAPARACCLPMWSRWSRSEPTRSGAGSHSPQLLHRLQAPEPLRDHRDHIGRQHALAGAEVEQLLRGHPEIRQQGAVANGGGGGLGTRHRLLVVVGHLRRGLQVVPQQIGPVSYTHLTLP